MISLQNFQKGHRPRRSRPKSRPVGDRGAPQKNSGAPAEPPDQQDHRQRQRHSANNGGKFVRYQVDESCNDQRPHGEALEQQCVLQNMLRSDSRIAPAPHQPDLLVEVQLEDV